MQKTEKLIRINAVSFLLLRGYIGNKKAHDPDRLLIISVDLKMNEQEQLRLSNDKWQQDNQRWQSEMQDWQRETQRLVGLLYMLEKALPEHSSQLDKHKARIDEHDQDLRRYRCGLEKNCMPECPSRIELDKLQHLHQVMAHSHKEMAREHDRFSKDYNRKMRRFRDLAERLQKELEKLID